MKCLLALASLLTLAAGRRYLCEDLTLPNCANGNKADYNPIGPNKKPPCTDDSTPTCSDSSTPEIRNNVCTRPERQCPEGQGKAGGFEPFDVCVDGSFPRCPNGKRETCPYHVQKCADRSQPRRQCRVGKPHCPWFTRNRNNEWNPTEEKFNRGPNRPQNKDSNHEG
jgi:hypothetical protein